MYLGHWMCLNDMRDAAMVAMYSSPIYAGRPQLPTLVIEQLTEGAVGRLAWAKRALRQNQLGGSRWIR
jgi:hypothetical protein